MGTTLESRAGTATARSLDDRRPRTDRPAEHLHGGPRDLLRADPRAAVGHRPAARPAVRRRQAALPRLPHRRPDRRKPDLFPDNWIYIHEPAVKVGRIQNFRSWSPEMVPDATTSCLGLEYFCFEGDGLWTPPTGADRARQEGARADRPRRRGRRQGRLRGAPEEGLSGLRRRLPGQRRGDPRRARRKFPTLHLVGRNGMHKYNNQDHAMMTAMLTVKNILAGARSTTCGTSTRTPSTTRPASRASRRRWAACGWCRSVSRPRE